MNFVSRIRKKEEDKKKAHTKNAFDLGCTTLKQSKRASQKKKKKKTQSVLIKKGRVSLSLSLSSVPHSFVT